MMNLPNKLTIIRVLLIPFFVFFLLVPVAGDASRYIALVVLLGVIIAVFSGDFETLRVKLGIYSSTAVILGATLVVPGILYAVYGIQKAVKSRSGDLQ